MAAGSASSLGGGAWPGSEAGDFLARYRQVSNKLKKRFLRKPNVAEAGEQFAQLARELRAQECLPYAAWCQLAVARCQQALFHGPGEALALTEAARLFLRQECATTQAPWRYLHACNAWHGSMGATRYSNSSCCRSRLLGPSHPCRDPSRDLSWARPCPSRSPRTTPQALLRLHLAHSVPLLTS